MTDTIDEASAKKLRKLEKNSDARTLDPWERYRALIDLYEAFFDMNELADRKTRFALVMMGALNALNVILGTQRMFGDLTGGVRPLVMIQCTGLFESGDALRNVLHEWRLPIYAIIGYRSYLNQDTLPGDTSLVFTEPILAAWKLDTRLITEPSQLESIADHVRACRAAEIPGVALIAEGKA